MDQLLMRTIMKTGNTVRRYADRQMERAGVDFPKGGMRIVALLVSHPEGEFFQKDIEESFALARSTVSGMLSHLEETGFIRREPVAGDARLKRVVPTEKAMELDAQVQRQAVDMEKTLTRNFSAEEKQQLLHLLERVRHNLQQC